MTVTRGVLEKVGIGYSEKIVNGNPKYSREDLPEISRST